jgi:hypothetical protein
MNDDLTAMVSWPATTQLTPSDLVSNWCQRPPTRPIWPVLSVSKAFAVNNLAF